MKNVLLVAAVVGALIWGWLAIMERQQPSVPTLAEVPELDFVSRFQFPAEMPEVPAELEVYKVLDPAMNVERFHALMDLFDLQGAVDEARDPWTIRNAGRMLEASIGPGTGYLRYSDEEKLLSEKEGINLLSDEEAVEKADAFLRENGWLPESAVLRDVDYYEYAIFDAQGELLDEGVTAVSVMFRLTLGGLPVDGPGAKVSATFGSDGQLIGAARIWRDVAEGEMRPTLPLESAIDRFKGFWPEEAKGLDVGRTTQIVEVVVESVYVAYYAEPGVMPQHALEPVLVFTGAARRIDPQGAASEWGDPFVYTVPLVE